MRNRKELAEYFAKLDFKKGAEIGVYLGYYSRLLLDTIPDLELLCIDSWEKNEARRRAYETVKEIFANYSGAKIIKGKSVEVAKTISDGSLDFVFIDASHYYQDVKDDLNAWTPKVRNRGIVAGHDYYDFPSGRGGVIEAVNEYVKKYKLDLKLTDWDKDNPYRDDRQPCWYFTKP